MSSHSPGDFDWIIKVQYGKLSYGLGFLCTFADF